MDQQWRLADGVILTHLEYGGWTVADLYRLSIHELDEESGAAINSALSNPTPDPIPPVVSAAAESGILTQVPHIDAPKEMSS